MVSNVAFQVLESRPYIRDLGVVCFGLESPAHELLGWLSRKIDLSGDDFLDCQEKEQAKFLERFTKKYPKLV